MANVSRTTLKGYFETDDVPTQSQFETLIESCLNILDDGALIGGEDNITAHAGGGQGSAYQLTKKCNRVFTTVNPGDSVKLPEGIPGMSIYIWNNGDQSIDCFPYTGGYIDDLAQNTAQAIGTNEYPLFFCYASNKWKMVLY